MAGSPIIFYVYHQGAAGSKSADTTITCLDHFICANVPPWVKHIAIVLDNAGQFESVCCWLDGPARPYPILVLSPVADDSW